MRNTLFYSSALSVAYVLVAAFPAAAQDTGVQTLEEVVITAQRFSESVQKAALDIDVITADQLEGLSDIRQLETLNPGINIGGGNVLQTYVRGIGSWTATNVQESAVSYNADGVFLATTTMVTPMMYDLQRVEVLKGPQGTLYGRNSSGGAVNIITNSAKLGEVEGYAEGELGNYELRRMTAAVNLPLGDTLAVRLAMQHAEHEGYLSDGSEDQDVTAGRIRVLWQPSSNITVTGGVDLATSDSVGSGNSISKEDNPTGDDWVGTLDPRLTSRPQFAITSPPPYDQFFKLDQQAVFVQADVDLGFGVLTVLPAYRREDVGYRTFSPGYILQDAVETEQRTLEVRLANRTDNLRWVLGAFYYNNEQVSRTKARNDANFQDNNSVLYPEVESYAFFAETTFSLTDKLRLIAGARYTDEESSSTGVHNSGMSPPPFFIDTPVFDPVGQAPQGLNYGDFFINTSKSNDAVTWKVGAEYDLAPDSMIFFTAARGFKSGGNYVDAPVVQMPFGGPRLINDTEFKPEYVTAYTLGARNRFFDGSLQVNGEIFHWKLKDQQVTYLGFNDSDVIALITTNAGGATITGAGLDVMWRATSNDTFRFAVEHLNADYDEFSITVPIFAALVQLDTACALTPATPGFSGVPRFSQNCAGERMLRTPEWAGAAGYEHVFQLGGMGALTWNTDVTFASERWGYISFTPRASDGSYALWNTSLTYTPPEGAYSITGWVRNITEERVERSNTQIGTIFTRDLLFPPRTFGVSARYNF